MSNDDHLLLDLNKKNPMLDSDGWDIGAVINDKLAPALDGEPIPKAVIAMLTFVMLLMKPSLQADEAEMGVMGASKFLMEYLNMHEPPEHEQRLMN